MLMSGEYLLTPFQHLLINCKDTITQNNMILSINIL